MVYKNIAVFTTSFFENKYGNLLHNYIIFLSNILHNHFIYEVWMAMMENCGHWHIDIRYHRYLDGHILLLYSNVSSIKHKENTTQLHIIARPTGFFYFHTAVGYFIISFNDLC